MSCLQNCASIPSFGSFQSYEAEIRERNLEWTLKYYTEILKREMDKACDRKQYRYVAGFLCSLDVYPGGRKAA